MHPRNKLRLAAGITIDPVLESREYKEKEAAAKQRRIDEAKKLEESNYAHTPAEDMDRRQEQGRERLQFWVDDGEGTGRHFGQFAVMTNRGDIHDTYDTEEEAQRVADELNAKYGHIELGEGEQYRITRTGPGGQNITVAKPGKATKRPQQKRDYDGDGKEETADAELKGMRDKAVKKYVTAGDKLRKQVKAPKEDWVPAELKDLEAGKKVKLTEAFRGREATVISVNGKKITLDVGTLGEGYYKLSDILVEAMHYYDEPESYPISHEDDDEDPINVVSNDDNEDTVFDGNYDKDESPTQLHALDVPSPQDQSGGGDLDRELTVPQNVLAALDREIKQARSEADVLDTSNKEAAIFYQDLATAMEDLANHLKKGTVYDLKKAQIFMTSLMGPMLHKIPAEVVKYIANGGQQRSLKSYMTDVSKDYPIIGPRNTLDDNDWT